MPNPTIVTLSSVGTSNAVAIDWRGFRSATCAVTLGSTTLTTDFTIQYTLDDLQLTASPVWFGLGSSIGSSVTHFSSANGDAGVVASFLAPIAGLRISSTALSSSSLTMRVLQSSPG